MPIPLQKGVLGRGLASLIGEVPPTGVPQLLKPGEQSKLPIEQLRPSGQNPRKAFDDVELAELADSIRSKGLLQPILVRPDPARGGYEIVAGERRWRAAQKASLHNVPVIVRELTDQEVLELAIIENVQRADLNPIEEATGYSQLMEQFGYTQEQVAEVIGKSRSHLANTLRLLKLPESVRTMVREGKLSAGHARTLVGRDDAETLAGHIVKNDLNVRATEQLVQGQERPVNRGGGGTRKDPDTRAFEKDMSDSLGLRVEIKPGSGESGQLTIKYGNFDQLDYIRSRLLGEAD